MNQLSFEIEEKICFNYDEQKLLAIVSRYHIKGSYPTPDRALPTKNEIAEVIDFTNKLLHQVCKILNISIEEIKK